VNIRKLTTDDTDGIVEFFGALSDQDLTFIRENVTDPQWLRTQTAQHDLRWGAFEDDGTMVGYATVNRLPGWSQHVGELRLVTRPGRRGGGVGRAISKVALIEALKAGMSKVVVELSADPEYAIAMFADLGFSGEALLRDHIRDRNGDLRDVVLLAHIASEEFATLDAVGLTDALTQ